VKSKKPKIHKFLELEADEGNDSDDGIRDKSQYKGGQDAYYKESDLKKRNKGLDADQLNEMEVKY
jgi:hypothetical protein